MQRTIQTKFFRFSQNNSGGYFEIDKKKGIASCVIIEAIDAKHACSIAKDLFEYYSDYCECCGERWSYYIDDDDGTDQPEIYGKTIEESLASYINTISIINLDGSVQWFEKEK